MVRQPTVLFTHLVHCFILIFTMATMVFSYFSFHLEVKPHINMFEYYGYGGSIVVTCLHFLPVVPALMKITLSGIGILFYNCFNNTVSLRASLSKTPFICFRTVTRGNFPNLVRHNAIRNRNLCIATGLKHFQMEIVTDIEIRNLVNDKQVRQIVVPSNYQTPKGTLYKARALQYALEDHVNMLKNADWIVHLDEESLLTPNSIRGIVNFISEGRYPIGQGLITYANENVVNWTTTFLDSFRVADDLGKLRGQLKFLHFLVSEWKGSFLVCRAGVEKSITFDVGPNGSICEDICFGLNASMKHYQLGYVEGEIWEKSPFTLSDFIKQRKRWCRGCYLIAFHVPLPCYKRLVFMWQFIGIFLVQTAVYFYVCNKFFPLSWTLKRMFDTSLILCFTFALHLHILGAVKSYTLYPRIGRKKLILFILGAPIAAIANCMTISILTVLIIFIRKSKFDVVDKNYKQILHDV